MYIVHTFLLSLCTEPMCVIGVVFWYNVNGECVEECKTWKARCERPTTKRAHNGMSEVCMKWIQTNRISHKLLVFLSFFCSYFFLPFAKVCVIGSKYTHPHKQRCTHTMNEWNGVLWIRPKSATQLEYSGKMN